MSISPSTLFGYCQIFRPKIGKKSDRDRWANRQTNKRREMQETSDFDIKLIWLLGLSSLIRSHKLSHWCFFTKTNVIELSFETFKNQDNFFRL